MVLGAAQRIEYLIFHKTIEVDTSIDVDEDYEERILPLVRAVAKSAPSVEHRYLLARALLSVGEAREALQVSEDVLARGDLSPADTSELRQRRGSLYWHRGDFQAALRERQASYEASPSPNRLVELANAFDAAGQPERALESLPVLSQVATMRGHALLTPLINQAMDDGCTPLLTASRKGHEEVAALLTAKLAD